MSFLSSYLSVNITRITLTRTAATLLTALTLSSCGGGGGGGGGTPPAAGSGDPVVNDDNNDIVVYECEPVDGDSSAPGVSLVFPPASSLTDKDFITVVGGSTDNSCVKSVTINGVLATSSDGYANWQAVVPLEFGQNNITASVEDGSGNQAAFQKEVLVNRSSLFLFGAFYMELDKNNDRLVLVDYFQENLIEYNLSDSSMRVLSGGGIGDGVAFDRPGCIALDSSGNIAYMVNSLSTILKVDLDSGDRAILSGDGVGEGPMEGQSWQACEIDTVSNNRMFIVDYWNYGSRDPVPVSVDLDNGDRQLIYDNGDSGVTLNGYSHGFHFNPLNLQLLHANEDALVSIDSFNGTGSIVASYEGGADEALVGRVNHSDIDVANNRFLVWSTAPSADSEVGLHGYVNTPGSLYAFNLETGSREKLFSKRYDYLSEVHKDSLSDMEYDDRSNRMYLLHNNKSERLTSLDLNDLQFTDLKNSAIGSINNPYIEVMAVNWERGDLFYVDRLTKKIFRVDLESGESVHLWGGTQSFLNPLLTTLADAPLREIALDWVNFEILGLLPSGSQTELIKIDMSIGSQELVSSADVGGGAVLIDATNLAVNAGTQKAYVIAGESGDRSVIEIDLRSGDRRQVEVIEGPDWGPWQPRYLNIDEVTGRLLIVPFFDGGGVGSFWLDVTTGVVDSINFGYQIGGVVFDSAKGRIYYRNSVSSSGIKYFDVAENREGLISVKGLPEASELHDFSVSGDGGVLIARESILNAVVGISTTTGEYVVLIR